MGWASVKEGVGVLSTRASETGSGSERDGRVELVWVADPEMSNREVF